MTKFPPIPKPSISWCCSFNELMVSSFTLFEANMVNLEIQEYWGSLNNKSKEFNQLLHTFLLQIKNCLQACHHLKLWADLLRQIRKISTINTNTDRTVSKIKQCQSHCTKINDATSKKKLELLQEILPLFYKKY